MRKVIVLGCVLAAVAITKLKLATPQGPQPLARALVTACNSSGAIWRCPSHSAKPPELLR